MPQLLHNPSPFSLQSMPCTAPDVSAAVTTLADSNENEVSEGSSDILQTHLPFLLHPNHCWPREKESFLLPVEHHLQNKLPHWHKTRDNGVRPTSLMNWRIAKFPWNEQTAVPRCPVGWLKRTLRVQAQSDWFFSETVQWKLWRRCQEQPWTLTIRVISLAEPLSWSQTGHRHWQNNKNNKKQTKMFPHSTESRLLSRLI